MNKFEELLTLAAIGAIYLEKEAAEGRMPNDVIETLAAENFDIELVKEAFIEEGISEIVKVAEDEAPTEEVVEEAPAEEVVEEAPVVEEAKEAKEVDIDIIKEAAAKLLEGLGYLK